nr:immunoglobulin heavy chain junction region [Mus musculus]
CVRAYDRYWYFDVW